MNKDRAENHPFYDTPGPIAIAHRGGDLAGMEKQNTLEAFESAIIAGVNYIETDTVKTADEVSVVFHGSEDLPQELRGGHPTSEQIESMTFNEVKRKLGMMLLRTEELLASLPDSKIFIDAKTDRSVAPLAQAIRKQKAEHRVNIGSFRYRRTQRVAALLDHKISTSFFKYRKIQAYQPGATLSQALNSNGFNTLQIPVDLISKRELERFAEAGFKVVAWPKMGPKTEQRKYDTLEYIKVALDAGFHGLMSDHTEQMKQAILARDPNNQSIRR